VGEEIIMTTKEYHRPMPALWWLHNNQLILFMIRELTSLFVAGYAVFLIILISKVNDAEAFKETLHCPSALAFQLIALPFVLFHSVTWFNLTPKAIVLFRGEERVSPLMIAGGHYALWVLVSGLILLVVLVV
jgi:fumarate reductase subunit C